LDAPVNRAEEEALSMLDERDVSRLIELLDAVREGHD